MIAVAICFAVALAVTMLARLGARSWAPLAAVDRVLARNAYPLLVLTMGLAFAGFWLAAEDGASGLSLLSAAMLGLAGGTTLPPAGPSTH